jgi:hypothetical protein
METLDVDVFFPKKFGELLYNCGNPTVKTLTKSVGSHGSLSLLFMMKVMLITLRVL